MLYSVISIYRCASAKRQSRCRHPSAQQRRKVAGDFQAVLTRRQALSKWNQGSGEWTLSSEDIFCKQYPLHHACREGDLEKLTSLLSAGAINFYEEDGLYGWTPVHWAAHFGKVVFMVYSTVVVLDMFLDLLIVIRYTLVFFFRFDPLYVVSCFLCPLQSIATHRDRFVRRLSVRPSVTLFCHTFQSYVSQATQVFLGMLPLFFLSCSAH